MAIIKTLRLQVFLLMAFLGAAQADKAYKPVFTPTVMPACAGPAKLTCTQGTDGDKAATYMRFLKDGEEVPVSPWTTVPLSTKVELETTNLDVTFKGTWACKGATSDDGAELSDISDATLPVTCTGCGAKDNEACTDEKLICNGTSTRTCKCKYGGQYTANTPGSCYVCAKNGDCTDPNQPRCDTTTNPGTPACADCKVEDNDGCDGVTPWCETAGQACKPCESNPNAGADKGCDPESATPRCAAPSCAKCTKTFCETNFPDRPVCGTGDDDGKCIAKLTTSAAGTTGASGGTTNKANTGDSNGSTGKHSDTTSSAGTVTSTACLVIASVVVALMI